MGAAAMSSQKSIMSFFARGAAAKTKGKESGGEKQDKKESEQNGHAEKKVDDVKKLKEGVDAESKENSSIHSNVDESKKEEKKEETKDGLPPLRKTAKRTVKRKSEAREENAKKAKKDEESEEMEVEEKEEVAKPVEQKKRTARKTMPGGNKVEKA